MPLGAFSVSLPVKDLTASAAFYKTLGFEQIGGNAEQNWLILRNGACVIGLFQGMIEKTTLTFNPGWAQDTTEEADFEDVRALVARLKASGIGVIAAPDPKGEGPDFATLEDPDGNAILFDQHVPKPKKA